MFLVISESKGKIWFVDCELIGVEEEWNDNYRISTRKRQKKKKKKLLF